MQETLELLTQEERHSADNTTHRISSVSHTVDCLMYDMDYSSCIKVVPLHNSTRSHYPSRPHLLVMQCRTHLSLVADSNSKITQATLDTAQNPCTIASNGHNPIPDSRSRPSSHYQTALFRMAAYEVPEQLIPRGNTDERSCSSSGAVPKTH